MLFKFVGLMFNLCMVLVLHTYLLFLSYLRWVLLAYVIPLVAAILFYAPLEVEMFGKVGTLVSIVPLTRLTFTGQWFFLKQICSVSVNRGSFFLGGGGVSLGGHLTFQILALLRDVVDIGKSIPNPIFFNLMKTEKLVAYQSSRVGLFCNFGPPPPGKL